MSSSSNAARLVVPFLLAGLLAGAPGAQRVLHESAADFRGLGYREFGFAVARAGDLDGDGRDDYWMAGPDYEGESDGIVYLCSGADGEPTLLLAGAPGERFGWCLVGARDLSGDGVADVVVGAPGSPGAGGGAVRAHSGADGSLLYGVSLGGALDRFGSALAFLDDRDGDGVPELAVGAPGAEGGRGRVSVLSGASGALLGALRGPSAGAEFGSALARIDDLDGDGGDELLVGAPRGGPAQSGLAVLVSARTGRALRVLTGAAGGDEFGHAVAAGGDLDGDGLSDVLVGAPGASAARAFSGASGAELWTVVRDLGAPSSYAFLAEPPGFGWALCSLGDQDGDGRDDVAVGAPAFSGVWFLSGADGGVLGATSSAYVDMTPAETLGGYFGWALARLGDADGDGRDELVVGAPLDDPFFDTPSPTAVGSAAVLALGAAPNRIHADDRGPLARAVARAGDVDGDGVEDLAYDATHAGKAEVVVASGRDLSVLRRLDLAIATHPQALACAGDVDADGVQDLAAVRATGLLAVFSGASGSELAGFGGWSARCVAGIGDVDGDGHDDLALGDPRSIHPSEGASCWSALPGLVRVVSGAGGALLFERAGEVLDDETCGPLGDVFGFSVCAAGDWNRDGVPDLAAGAPGAGEFQSGAVRVLSGLDGALLAEFAGLSMQSEFGIAVSGGADFDFDADGFVDLVVGEQTVGYGPHPSYGAAFVFSSRDGARLFAGGTGTATIGYGRPVGPAYSVAALRDFDGDGFSDVAVGNPAQRSALGPGAGEVRVVSGRTHGVLRTVTASSSWDYLGYSLAALPAADGTTSVLAGAPALEPPAGRAYALRIRRAGPDLAPRADPTRTATRAR